MKRTRAEPPDDDTVMRAELDGGSVFFVLHDPGPDGDGIDADRSAERQPSLGNGWRCFIGADVAPVPSDPDDELWCGEGDAVLFVAEEGDP